MNENSTQADGEFPAQGEPCNLQILPSKPNKPYWVYLLECEGNSLYCGIALDVQARFAQHTSGTGAAYTRSHKPLRVACAVEFESRSLALKAEIQVKKMPKGRKLSFLRGLDGAGVGGCVGFQAAQGASQ
jgi:putative endonuclease